jgi:Golgi nucleoside diphosphatase
MYNSKAKPAVPLRRSAVQIIVCVAFLCGVLYGLIGFSDQIGLSSTYKVGLGSPRLFEAGLTEDAIDKLPKESFNYLAMIDAGSSGCRAHIFRYGLLGSSSGPLYVLPKHTSKKVKPGLSTFASNPTKAGESLQGLIDFMKEEVPEAQWAETPIWLKATAGLRMLDEAASTAVIRSVQDFLGDSTKSPFYFRSDFARIIPGVEEGAFGWISVNYMKKIIGPFRQSPTVPTAETAYAVVEMGGASTQVSDCLL